MTSKTVFKLPIDTLSAICPAHPDLATAMSSSGEPEGINLNLLFLYASLLLFIFFAAASAFIKPDLKPQVTEGFVRFDSIELAFVFSTIGAGIKRRGLFVLFELVSAGIKIQLYFLKLTYKVCLFCAKRSVKINKALKLILQKKEALS